jgi:RNA polymerase sigma-70 factor (ECF subfamily)
MLAMTEIERELAYAARTGDREALEELTRRLYRPVCALAARLLDRMDDAREIARETFARVACRIAEWQPDKPFSAWVFTIAANLCRDRHRRSRRTRRLESQEDSATSGMGLIFG